MVSRLTFEERLEAAKHPLLKKLLEIIISKKSNLCIAANLHSFEELAQFIDVVGPHICVLKTQNRLFPHVPLKKFNELLLKKKREYNFLVFEDNKFNESPDIVERYYESHVDHADLVTVDRVGSGIFNALRRVVKNAKLPEDEPRGCLGLVELSYLESLPGESDRRYQECEKDLEMCVGIIAQKYEIPTDKHSSLLKFTPGINIGKTGDGKGQQWRDPSAAMAEGTDVIIVGRGITAVPEAEWETAAIHYKEVAFQAYLGASKPRV